MCTRESRSASPEVAVLLGVARSGTTLLRCLLGKHSQIHSLPETPWITGAYVAVSIRHLYEHLVKDHRGPVRLLNCSQNLVTDGIRELAKKILNDCLTQSGKRILVIKTPDDIENLDFLITILENARFIHIVRDGRDVALSTIQRLRAGEFARQFGSSYGTVNFRNAMRRWHAWECRIERNIAEPYANRYLRVKFEDLVTDPQKNLEDICSFLDLSFEREMIGYDMRDVCLPEFEMGSRDVRRQATINAGRASRWISEIHPRMFSAIDSEFGEWLANRGYMKCAEGKIDEIESGKYMVCTEKDMGKPGVPEWTSGSCLGRFYRVISYIVSGKR